MKSQYFCMFHTQRLKARESEAIAAWSQLMHHGIKAYSECRISDAYTYLAAATDIALLRSDCAVNGIFSELHLIKPAEFLIQLQLAEQRYTDATMLLNRLSTLGDLPSSSQSPTLNQFIELEWRHVEAVKTLHASDPSHHRSSEQMPLATVIPLHRH